MCKTALITLSLLVLLSCAAGTQLEYAGGVAAAEERLGRAAAIAVQAPDLEPYVEEISGTTVSFEMLPVPAGSVELETPEGTQTVEVDPFWMSKTEVTWDVYDVYLYGLDREGGAASGEADAVSRPSKPYVLPGEHFGHQGRPALSMTYHAAEQFSKWLSAKTGRTYRLPTEAEWEHACRAGGAGETLQEHAWYWENAQDKTQLVASLQPDALGLHDLLGNVAEWVSGIDGTPVIKGGSFRDDLDAVHCGARQAQTPAWNATDPQLPKSTWWLSDAPFLGLRLVREP